MVGVDSSRAKTASGVTNGAAQTLSTNVIRCGDLLFNLRRGLYGERYRWFRHWLWFAA